MDFFQSQEKARKQTGRLVLFYGLAIICIILSVYVATVTILFQTTGSTDGAAMAWSPEIFFAITGITLLIVSIGTLWKMAQLRSGGAAVATQLGGQKIDPQTKDLHERRLLNIIEEMALASGTAVPEVYLLNDEEGINAFAAGYTSNDAAIGVTRGCMRKLTRDELQGVIAHEFSHILNGDMRLNIRLIGVLNGILVIYLIGYTLMRFSGGRRSYRSSSSDSKNSGNGIILFGLSLVLIGCVGAFFANLIKSAVSRQREFLADASAVQFTRNPLGIGGALKKIGGFVGGSTLATPKAEEASHMFFANGLSSFLGSLFATHPPLPERIKRIDPSFSGQFDQISQEYEIDPNTEQAMGFSSNPTVSAKQIEIAPQMVTDHVGNPTAATLDFAKGLLSSIPESLRVKSHTVSGAVAILSSLLISDDSGVREKQIAHLRASSLSGVSEELKQIYPLVSQLDDQFRLALLDLSLSALKGLTIEEFDRLSESIVSLVQADGEVSLFEFVLIRIVTQALESHIKGIRSGRAKYFKAGEIRSHLELLISALAYYGSDNQDAASQAFKSGAEEFNGLQLSQLPKERCALESLNTALNELNRAAPLLKKSIISACVRCAARDGKTTLAELELLRAISSSLECPLPPLV